MAGPTPSAITEAEKGKLLKEVRRAVKKAKNFAVQKTTRKLKACVTGGDSEERIEAVEADVDMYKELDLDVLAIGAWDVHQDKKSMNTVGGAEEDARVRELMRVVVQAAAVKTCFVDMGKKRLKAAQKKQKKKSKSSKGKEEAPKKNRKLREKLQKIKQWDVVEGLVDGVESYGVFIDFWCRKEEYRGLLHISEVSGKKIDDLSLLFDVGDPVRVVVLAVDLEEQKVALTMKPANFPSDDPGWKVIARPRLKRSATAQGRQAGQQGGSQGQGGQVGQGMESLFMSTLGEEAAADSEAVRKRKRKEELGRQVAAAKGLGNKRMGQRARQELMEELYGLLPKPKPVKPPPAATPTATNDDDDEASSDKKEKKAFVPVSRAERKRRKRGLEPSTPAPTPAAVGGDDHSAEPAAKKAKKNKPVKQAQAVKSKSKSQEKSKEKPKSKEKEVKKQAASTYRQAPPADDAEGLHPSWAARRKETGLITGQGKKVTF